MEQHDLYFWVRNKWAELKKIASDMCIASEYGDFIEEVMAFDGDKIYQLFENLEELNDESYTYMYEELDRICRTKEDWQALKLELVALLQEDL